MWTGVSVGSLLLALGGMALLPRVVARLPTDWVTRPALPLRAAWKRSPWRVLGRNLLGLLLLVLGILMLFLPGQGLLTMVLGLLLLDTPLRPHLTRFLARRRPLARALQRLRAWADAPPLEGLDDGEEAP